MAESPSLDNRFELRDFNRRTASTIRKRGNSLLIERSRQEVLARKGQLVTNKGINSQIVRHLSDQLKKTETLGFPETSDQILSAYGVEVKFPRMIGNIEIPVSLDNLIRFPNLLDKINNFTEELKTKYKDIIAAQLIVYPRDFFKNNGIKKLFVVSTKQFGGTYIPSTGDLYFAADSLLGISNTYNPFHHEMFHRLEHKTKKGRKFRKEWDRQFPRLSLLRKILFKLAGTEIPIRFQEYSKDKYKKRGIGKDHSQFVTNYASSDPDEDRSETAEMMLSKPELFIRYLGTLPEVKGSKISMVMSLYCNLSGGKMDTKYFADFAEGKVDANYWRMRS